MSKLTIITINYNNLRGLQRTIPSILSQSYKEFEMIVVDGGSTDGSKEYIQSLPRIDQWVSEPDAGIYNAMNKAVGMAHGEYCIFMNSGDMFFSAMTLEEAVPFLKGADICTGATIYVGDDMAYRFPAPEEITLDFMIRFALSHQATFSRTELLRRHPFNESHKIVSDWEWSFEMWYKHGCTYQSMPCIIATYFLDGISSLNQDLSNAERKEVMMRLFGMEMYEELFVHGKYKYLWKKPEAVEDKYERERLQRKINIAMSQKPLKRDLKIIRNAMKFLLRDLIRSIYPDRKR
ncbi:MAG: glycosyltransferase [Prevotella sp.]|nr:glycosyltransferase [Prevotella sp.]